MKQSKVLDEEGTEMSVPALVDSDDGDTSASASDIYDFTESIVGECTESIESSLLTINTVLQIKRP